MASRMFPLFCADSQEVVNHTLEVDANGEVILTSPTGRVIKLPAGTTATQLKEFAAKHKAANEGQLSVEKLEQQTNALFDELDAL